MHLGNLCNGLATIQAGQIPRAQEPRVVVFDHCNTGSAVSCNIVNIHPIDEPVCNVCVPEAHEIPPTGRIVVGELQSGLMQELIQQIGVMRLD